MLSNEVVEEAYAEHGEREFVRSGRPDFSGDDLADHRSSTGAPRVSDRSDLGSPGGEATDTPSPNRSRKTLTVGSGFDTPTWDLGDDHGNEDRADRPGGKRYRPNPSVNNDLRKEGHGFNVWKTTTNPDVPEVCRYCGDRLLTPDETSPCEFNTPTHPGPLRAGTPAPRKYGVPRWFRAEDGRYRRPYDSEPAPAELVAMPGEFQCRCNGCVIRREGKRKRGGQEVACYAPACRKRLRADQNARTRERRYRRDRLMAVEVIRCEPHRSDTDIAAELGIRPKRVKEARELLSV